MYMHCFGIKGNLLNAFGMEWIDESELEERIWGIVPNEMDLKYIPMSIDFKSVTEGLHQNKFDGFEIPIAPCTPHLHTLKNKNKNKK